MKDKEWFKKEIGKSILSTGFDKLRLDMNIVEFEYLLDQLDEPEKPVIPQFVADWIEQSREDNYDVHLLLAFIDSQENKELWNWLFPSAEAGKRENQDKLVRAWLDGYEVEKEKLYYIKLPTKTGFSYLNYDVDEGVHFDNFKGTRFTEAEIKAIDKRYWVFAEEVTE